jgi:hypothetical protein
MNRNDAPQIAPRIVSSSGVSQRATLRRQHYAARVSLKQRYAERRFETPHVMTDGARSQVQLLGGVCKVLVASSSREHSEGRQHGGTDRHQTRAIFVTGARSMRLQGTGLQGK